jgi:hypothetical protein
MELTLKCGKNKNLNQKIKCFTFFLSNEKWVCFIESRGEVDLNSPFSYFKDEDSRLYWDEPFYLDKKRPFTEKKIETNQTQVYLEYIDRNPLIKHHNKKRLIVNFFYTQSCWCSCFFNLACLHQCVVEF